MGSVSSCCVVQENYLINELDHLEFITNLLPTPVPDKPWTLNNEFILTESKFLICNWSRYVYNLGWNIQIQKKTKYVYLISISNRYLNPLNSLNYKYFIYLGNFYEAEDCVVCTEYIPTEVILPCGHLCLCEYCKSIQIQECPICRGRIIKIESKTQLNNI